MTGEEVKRILLKRGYTLKAVAQKMGETPQNFQAMLKVADIKTGVLERIGKAIGENVFVFFNSDETLELPSDISDKEKFAIEKGMVVFTNEEVEMYKDLFNKNEELIRLQKDIIFSLERRIRIMNLRMRSEEDKKDLEKGAGRK